MDKLIYIYSVDTSSFYNDVEYEIDQRLINFKQLKSSLNKTIIQPLNNFKNEVNKLLNIHSDENKLKLEEIKSKWNEFTSKNEEFKLDDYIIYDKKENRYKINIKSSLYLYEQCLNACIRELKKQLNTEAINHKGKRTLRKDALKDSNKISLFESTLTRSLGIKEDELSTDIVVVRAYRYIIFEDIIKNGFRYENEDYEYFASSAGQIRTKKSCFIKINALNKNNHEVRNKLMCGLSINKINRKGGINQNKFQAYLSLANSASKYWEGFDIDRCIVVDDMELEVSGLVDYIDHETYKIERIEKNVSIDFMDGAGIMLPSVSKKSFQFRMPFFKGLLIPFNYLKFLLEYPNANYIVKDIYGKEHNIFKDRIQIIFTKSQFKLSGYYKNWNEYKKYFKKYNCEASICKVEEDVFEDKPINYQMIQSLHFSNTELEILSKKTIEDILSIGENKETMLRLLGADENNVKKNYFQQALSIYPELLNDEHSKQAIKDRKKSLVKEAKSGKILMEGTKRTYISPDLYAFAEWLFVGVEIPNGLLKDGEVSCKLFGDEKVDVLRSPHLFREHCVRKNIINDETKEWFITNCIYTSVFDRISKQLMFDVDGDDALIVREKLFVSRAEEQMKDIVPLEYTLATAKKSKITNDHIISSLKAAYSKNIGEISNLITKIWNSDNQDLSIIKILCMENNAIIDFAKTLWMPNRPDEIDEKIKEYSNKKVPYFFQFAKDKEKNKVEEINNSTINKLTQIIPDKRINFISVAGKFDYKNLMRNKRQKINDELSRKIIETYTLEDQNKSNKVKSQVKENDKNNMQTELKIYKQIRNNLLKITNNPNYICDVLVKYLYDEKNSKFKDTLWRCFGKEIVRNLECNVQNIKRCLKCGTPIRKINKRKYCNDCAKKINIIKTTENRKQKNV